MSKNIVFEGWLTKSPPSKRIWRTKWRRRWFALRQSGELPGQYFLDYYADRNCRRLKGTINLDLCEQVDAGLHMDRTGSSLNPKLRGSVFTIQTQSRTYHLEADCQAEMEQWVDAICRVCGLRATDETPEEIGTCPSNIHPITSQPCSIAPETTGPYIPISECITGVRAQDSQRAFTFDHKNIVTSTRSTLERMADQKDNHLYTSQPQMRSPNNEFSENESNLSEEECKSLTSSQSNIKDIEVAKSFTKLTVSPEKNGESEEGPPVPPRPPKTFAMSKEMFASDQDSSMRRAPRRISQAAPPSAITRRLSVDEDEESHNQSLQYCNIAMPPAVDRALKPRSSIYTIGSISTVPGTHYVRNSSGAVIFRKNPQQGGIEASYIKFVRPPIVPPVSKPEEVRSDTLQYLDLDLPPLSESSEASRKLQEIRRRDQGKSFSGGDSDCAYKTVDFLKTEAFNITRQDAEASRSNY